MNIYAKALTEKIICSLFFFMTPLINESSAARKSDWQANDNANIFVLFPINIEKSPDVNIIINNRSLWRFEDLTMQVRNLLLKKDYIINDQGKLKVTANVENIVVANEAVIKKIRSFLLYRTALRPQIISPTEINEINKNIYSVIFEDEMAFSTDPTNIKITTTPKNKNVLNKLTESSFFTGIIAGATIAMAAGMAPALVVLTAMSTGFLANIGYSMAKEKSYIITINMNFAQMINNKNGVEVKNRNLLVKSQNSIQETYYESRNNEEWVNHLTTILIIVERHRFKNNRINAQVVGDYIARTISEMI